MLANHGSTEDTTVSTLFRFFHAEPEQPYNANRDLLVEIGVVLGMLGLAAFIVLLEELFD